MMLLAGKLWDLLEVHMNICTKSDDNPSGRDIR